MYSNMMDAGDLLQEFPDWEELVEYLEYEYNNATDFLLPGQGAKGGDAWLKTHGRAYCTSFLGPSNDCEDEGM